MSSAKRFVTFTSHAFNVREQRDNFINPDNFGDDVARWLIAELRKRGYKAEDEPGQEDFGWYVSFQCEGAEYNFIIGHRDDSNGEWLGWLEKSAGLLGSIFGARRRDMGPEAPNVMHNVLSSAPEITNIRWHDAKDFEQGREERGTTEP